jgi:hypothetical protein
MAIEHFTAKKNTLPDYRSSGIVLLHRSPLFFYYRKKRAQEDLLHNHEWQ